MLADGRLASGSIDKTILLWDLTDLNVNPLLLFVADAGITALITHPFYGLLIAGDYSGRLHWLRNESWRIKPPKNEINTSKAYNDSGDMHSVHCSKCHKAA